RQNKRFVFNATEFPEEEEYDYIIVGGGTAGCPLAATLSEEYRVLLLERGGQPSEYRSLATQDGFLPTIMNVDAYRSPAQGFTSEDGVRNARGRVLGGSSAINAGFYSRAHPGFFEKGGWDMALVNRSYEWVESAVAFKPSVRTWQQAVRDGLLAANITPYNGYTVEHLVGTKIGASTFDGRGRRHSSVNLLGYARRTNLRVAIHATVEKILLSPVSVENTSSSTWLREEAKQEAYGVVYRDQQGFHHWALIRRDGGEVILCAGALGSPQLLLLSGIGPASHLSFWGIPPAHNLPGVGQSVVDNPRVSVSILSSFPLRSALIQTVGIPPSGSAFIEAASNVLPFTSYLASAFLPPFLPIRLSIATLMAKVASPRSRGTLRLASTDARDNPSVRFNYFSQPADLASCAEGVRLLASVMASESMSPFKFVDRFGNSGFRFVGPRLPANLSDNGEIADFCRRAVTTIWHYHGGCLVGKVVDRQYRVFGVSSLRVVDSSTFSVSPGTNPQATVMMLGR
ncbi:(R)-mandelonitrile lyase-like, partial [Nymphaea thermarum]